MLHALKSQLRRWPLAESANSLILAPLQEYSARTALRRCQLEADQRGIEPPDDVELGALLRARIGKRAAALGWPKKCGDLHIFLAYSVTNWEAILPSALASFGAVTAFDWRALGFDEASRDWVARRDDMNRAMLAAFDDVNSRRPVDVVVACVSGFTVAPELLLEMARRGAAVTNFCFDDKLHWPGRIIGGRNASTASIAHAVDLNLTNDPQATVKYLVHGGLSMFHAEAADPQQFSPLDLPFEYDLSFIGARYGWRPRFIARLQSMGFNVACFGRGWPNGPVSIEAMRAVYAKSRINLGFGGVGHSRNLVCLKGRDFEVPMSGALYLTQRNPELDLVFDVEREIVTFEDEADCALQARALLDDPELAASIRLAGRQRCLRDHSYQTRWTRVFQTLGLLT